MANQTQVDNTTDSSNLRSDVLMHRNIKKLEESDIYKNAPGPKQMAMQKDFYKQFVIPYNKEFKENITFFDWAKGRKKPATGGESTSTLEKIGGGITGGVTSLIAAPYHGIQKLDQEYQQAAKTVSGVSDYIQGRGFVNPVLPRTDVLPETRVRSEKLDALIKSEQEYGERHYDNNLKDTALRTGGEIVGQLPAFELTGGILSKTGLDVLINPELWSKSPVIARMGGRLLYNAMQGYLVGKMTDDDPVKTAGGFAIGSEIFRPVEKVVGKVLGLGGQTLVSQLVDHGKKAVENGDVSTKVAPITVALAGSEKQKITAGTVRLLNEMVGGNWAKATMGQKKEALGKLGKIAPEIGGQLAAVNKSLVEAEATISTTRQRKVVPEFNDILTKLEQIDKTPTAKSVADSVSEKATARQMVKTPGQIKVGAASRDSLEFESAYTKTVDLQLAKLGLGKDKIVFEDRGHKLLFYLNALLTENRALGPTKERNKMFNLLTRHLNDRFPDKSLSDLMKMSDKVWSDMENLTKAEHMSDTSGPVRYFRQHTLDASASPFSHEVKLLEEAHAKDQITNKFEKDEVEKHLAASRMPVPDPKYDAKLQTEGQKLEESTALKARESGDKVIKGREKRTRVRGPEEQKLNAAWAQARKEFGDTKDKITEASTEQIEARVRDIMAGKTAPTSATKSGAEIDTLAYQQARRILGANAKSQEITDLTLQLKEDPSRGGTTFAEKIKRLKEGKK
jgi:hypothetical protein